MGEHKEENEDLIKYGWDEDIWFHVDHHSSAHDYLRLKEGQGIQDIPPAVLEDCCQLVKANSIEGNKVDNVAVVYTPWSNLKKTNGMDVGQVGFHYPKQVKKDKVLKRKNEIINRLNKTKREDFPDLAALRGERDKAQREKNKRVIKQQQEKEKRDIEQKMKDMEIKSYSSIMVGENMKTNREIGKTVQEYEDDFM